MVFQFFKSDITIAVFSNFKMKALQRKSFLRMIDTSTNFTPSKESNLFL